MASFGSIAPRLPGQTTTTALDPLNEMAFRQWVSDNNVPFDLKETNSDYDMRGFWQALQSQSPIAKTSMNSNDGRLHFPDYWKTPSHQTFSNESQWSGPTAPAWNEADQLVSPAGRIVYDEKRPPVTFGSLLGIKP